MLTEKQLILLQGLVNQAIKIDPLSEKRLEPINGKSLRLQCNDPETDVQISIEQGLITLTQGLDEVNVTTHIQGDFSAFVQVLTSEDKTSSLINSSLTVKGDSQLLIQLQQALTGIDFDWEYHLAKMVGDLPAHHLGQLSRHGFNFLKQSQPIFKRHLKEFLLDEARLTPQLSEFDHFVSKLQKTEQQLERVEVKLHKINTLLANKE